MKVNIYEFLQNGYLCHLLPFLTNLSRRISAVIFLLWLKFYGNLMFGFSVVLNFVYKEFDQILVGMCQFWWSYGKYYRIFDENARRGRGGCWKIGLILVESYPLTQFDITLNSLSAVKGALRLAEVIITNTGKTKIVTLRVRPRQNSVVHYNQG